MPPPISLAQALSDQCDPVIRQRGVKYFREGRVRIDSVSGTHVVARVRGSETYRVNLYRDGQTIQASCTCPYFDVEACKHVWAVILAADQQRLLQGQGQFQGHTGGRDLRRAEAPARDGEVYDEEPRLIEPTGQGSIDLLQYDRLLPSSADDYGELDDGFSRVAREAAPREPGSRKLGNPDPPRQGTARDASLRADWRKRLAQLRATPVQRYVPASQEWRTGRELLYVIDRVASRAAGGVCIEIFTRDRKKDGNWSKPKSRYMARDWLHQLPDGDDRLVLASLSGATVLHGGSDAHGYSDWAYSSADFYAESIPFRYRVPDALAELVLPAVCRTGRCRLRLLPRDEEPTWPVLRYEPSATWQLRLNLHRREGAKYYDLRGELVCESEHLDLAVPHLLLCAGFVFVGDRIARFDHQGGFDWVRMLREHGPLLVPTSQGEDFVAELLRQSELPDLVLPPELHYQRLPGTPRPRLSIKAAAWEHERLHGKLSFDYDGQIIGFDDPCACAIQPSERRAIVRNRSIEQTANDRLRELGWRAPTRRPSEDRSVLEITADRLPQIVNVLTQEGWHVEAQGKIYRTPVRFDLKVSSGVDWFELHGTLQFGDTSARLPELLAAVKRGENMVRLGDGNFGLLPQEWLDRYGLLTRLGTSHEDHVRFTRTQAGLLDALVSVQPEIHCDELFCRVREELQRFEGVQSTAAPSGFQGELRPYQKEGLGWLHFLHQFGFGGCLADDMGLGKTVQVLALLEARRGLRAGVKRGSAHPIGPSLVIVPRSLIFNWKQEAERFAPGLRVLDHTGHTRRRTSEHFNDYDLILTTYGTLRRDLGVFSNVRFDYVILDEAQAIKNADSISAKAARLLRADHRLALSGTPIENHLGELWSLFEFLNPGMLGTASIFRSTQDAWRNPDDATRKMLAHALRPFVLRRTKEQVVADLPPKVEQTLYCELESKQRRLYDELRDHYRQSLLKRVERDGIARSKIQILEALLRLRQAALHPGLLDERRTRDPCAKLEALQPMLLEVLEEGHKVLVFSQFTRMLGILREGLDEDGIQYAYLDGRTKDRESVVNRFQTDADCKLFLISLKAGGLGLNLTAAEYVFLLDPWWNPAIEAQAIDRAHRIGQANRVFAYRFISRNTVEEKVLELQGAKRDLADAIIGADKGSIANLRREDLERLLS